MMKCYAPIKVMPHLPPTGHSGGLDHFCVLIPLLAGIFGGLIPGGTTRFRPIIIVFLCNHCAPMGNFNILLHPSENGQAAIRNCMHMLHVC